MTIDIRFHSYLNFQFIEIIAGQCAGHRWRFSMQSQLPNVSTTTNILSDCLQVLRKFTRVLCGWRIIYYSIYIIHSILFFRLALLEGVKRRKVLEQSLIHESTNRIRNRVLALPNMSWHWFSKNCVILPIRFVVALSSNHFFHLFFSFHFVSFFSLFCLVSPFFQRFFRYFSFSIQMKYFQSIFCNYS